MDAALKQLTSDTKRVKLISEHFVVCIGIYESRTQYKPKVQLTCTMIKLCTSFVWQCFDFSFVHNISVSAATHEEKEGSTQHLLVPDATKDPTSSWYSCCCFRCFHSSPRKSFFSPTPTARRSARADNDSLVQKPWYHSDISWEKSVERLKAQDSDCFLVKKSQSQPGKYVLCVSYGEDIKPHTICVHAESVL